MFGALSAQPADPIIDLLRLFAEDQRPDKLDLGVGVFRDRHGNTPIFAAVKAAEQRIWQEQVTKSYVGIAGDLGFRTALQELVLGPKAPTDRIASVATPGGTSAVRQLFELATISAPQGTVWLPDPTWPNHPAILQHLGHRVRVYRYYDRVSGTVDLDGMLHDLQSADPGDLVLMHACCHNPTGADLDMEGWKAFASLIRQTGATPFVDCAYQGFGDGLEADVAGLRHLAETLPELLLSVSCSKNFGVYRERVAVAFAITASPTERTAVQSHLEALNRNSFTFPPDHGARVVTEILNDPHLRKDWKTELSAMRETISRNRVALSDALQQATRSDRFGYLASQKGMFSELQLGIERTATLRSKHGIYVVGDGRINLAGATPDKAEFVARAIADVLPG